MLVATHCWLSMLKALRSIYNCLPHSGSHTLIGQFETCVDELFKRQEPFPLTNPNVKNKKKSISFGKQIILPVHRFSVSDLNI